MRKFTNYHSRYGYPRWIALVAEFWWRLEHVEWITGVARRYAYFQRKRWERYGWVGRTENERWREHVR